MASVEITQSNLEQFIERLSWELDVRYSDVKNAVFKALQNMPKGGN